MKLIFYLYITEYYIYFLRLWPALFFPVCGLKRPISLVSYFRRELVFFWDFLYLCAEDIKIIQIIKCY